MPQNQDPFDFEAGFAKNRCLKKILKRLGSLLCLLLAMTFAWKMLGNAGISYDWHWHRIWRYFGHVGPDGFVAGPLLSGIWLTIAITAVGLVLSLLLGLATAWLRLSPWPVCVMAARGYVALWRNTPLLLQLFMAYFLLSPLIHTNPFWTAALALGLFEGAYFAEIFRAGILGVHRNQWEAGLSLGLGLWQTFFLVVLPQATRSTLPALTNQAIALLKDSSLVSAIAVADLTMQSQAIVAESFLAFEVWLAAGVIYLALALILALPSLWLERHNPLNRSAT